MPRLVIEKGIDKGAHVDLASRGALLVGRDAASQLRLRDMMASRQHFRLEHRADAWWLADLKSMNGTFVNGQRVQEARLAPGDHVQVGETLLVLVADEDVQAQDDRLGTVLAGYLIQEHVGHGGMGTVYRAEQLSLRRIVALKVISEAHTKEPAFVDLFLREARAAAQLNHPNIVQVYDAKGVEGTYFYSMEFVPHGSVQDLLAAQKKLPAEQAAKMALQAARGLEYAERKDIVHRDIKPDNLMIGELDVIKIADLGLAQSAKEASRMDDSRTVLGTPHYIAPELVLGKPPDHRVDIYSLGASLYRMLSGTTPYSGANVTEIVQNKIRQDPPLLHELDPSIPKPLSDIVHRMMARNPAERYQKPSDVVAALEGFLAGPGSTYAAAARATGLRPPLAWVAAAVAAALVLTVAAFLLVFAGRGNEPVGPVNPATNAGHAVAPPPDENKVWDKLAKAYYKEAVDFEAKQLKKESEVSIRENIALYQKILDECPRSALRKDAEARIAALRALQARAAAQSALHEAGVADTAAYQAMLQGLKQEPPVLDRIRAAVREVSEAYAKVASAHPDSDAAVRAQQIQKHLEDWMARVEAAVSRLDEVDAAAKPEIAGKRFGTALSHWKAYAQDCEAKALKSPFADGRYGTLPVTGVAQLRIREIRDEAARAFQAVQKEATDLLAADKFDEAKALYRHVLDTFGIPDLDARARQEIAAIDRKIIEKLDNERRAAEDRERKRLQDEEQRFRQALQAALELVKRYEFQKAADGLRSIAAALTADKHKASAANRIQDLEIIARLKGEFIRRANDPQGRDLLRSFRAKSQAGEILGATDDRITLQVTDATGGTAEIPVRWTDLAPREFCAFFRNRWLMTAPDFLGLGGAWLEFGFLDEAEEGLKQAQAKAADDAVRLAAARRLDDLAAARRGGGSGDREQDAERRLARARALAEQKRFAEARQELDALLKSAADTETVRKARAEIEALLKEAGEKAKDDDDRGRRAQRLQRYKDAMALELRDAQARRREIRERLKLIPSDLDRRHQTLQLAVAWQEGREAAPLADELHTTLLARLPALASGGDLAQAAQAYRTLLQFTTLNGDKTGFDRLVKEAAAPLASHEPWTARILPQMTQWQAETYPAALADVKKLKADLDADPSPDLLWRLCKLLRRDVPLRLEERQSLRALLDAHPDFSAVAQGDVLHRLAENALVFLEIQNAQTLLSRLKGQFPNHPRVKDADASGSVQKLLLACDSLAQKLGYKK